MGSVRFNRQRETWFIDYIDATGQRMRQTIGAGDEGRRFARKVLAQREAEAQMGIHRLPPSHTPTFQAAAADWLERVRARGLRPKTLESYEDMITSHLVPAFGEMRLGGITRRDVEAYLVERTKAIRRRRKDQVFLFAPATINKSRMVLRAILEDAVDRGAIRESPAAKVAPLHEPDREDGLAFLQLDEISRLLDVAGEPWRTVYLTAVHTGLRRGELLALRWRDVDLRKGTLAVRRSLNRIQEGEGYVVRESPLKTRASRRTVDLSQAVIQALLALPAGDDAKRDFVFRSQVGGAIDPDNVTRAWKRHLTAAGLADRPFHSTRHTHASLLIAANVHPKAIQARLGHASITTTLNTYGHLMPSAFEGVGSRLDELLGVELRWPGSSPRPDEDKATPRQQTARRDDASSDRSPKPAS